MLSLVSWWIALQLIGLAALPVAFRLLRRLPDRGYAFARPLGLLLAGYIAWLGGMFGLVGSSRGSVALIVIVGGIVAWGLSRDLWSEIAAFFWRERALVLVYEVLFLGVLAAWSLFKAYNPEIAYTEKPMEMAFLNAILRSDRFPPLDPWLSGYSISYYYFGYLLVALLTMLSGVPSQVTYNLAVPTLMALTVTGAFSVVLGLTGRRPGSGEGDAPFLDRPRLAAAGLGAFFVAIMGNLEGFLELLHAKGLAPDSFWQWLDVYNLASAPRSDAWYPTDNWWWWRASRVINDVVLGSHREIIDEFPFFSFMLADLHPHVLALPFVLLALALGVDQVLAPAESDGHAAPILRWLGRQRFQVLMLALCLGALGFLNSWDFPTYTGVVVLGIGLRRWRERGSLSAHLVEDVLAAGLVIGGLGLVLYLPFYLTFQSQASGVGIVLLEKTRLRQYLIIHGVFLWALLPLLWAGKWRVSAGWLAIALAAALPCAVALLIGWWTTACLIALLTLIAWRLFGSQAEAAESAGGEADAASSIDLARRLALAMAAVGLLLTLVTEFAFIRDTFGNRMNTVFKLYYQAWVLLAIAAAYGVYYATTGRRQAAPVPTAQARSRAWSLPRAVWAGGLALLVLAASYYPLAATYTKANLFSGTPTLDGTALLARAQPGDFGAIHWLNENASGAPVILEAAGGEYTDYARISTFTGLPAVLGWGGHELQWRGNYVEPGKREPDIDAIYRNTDRATAQALLRKYDVTYVIVGRMEREKGYDAAGLGKFRSFMDVVYDRDGTTIYRSRD